MAFTGRTSVRISWECGYPAAGAVPSKQNKKRKKGKKKGRPDDRPADTSAEEVVRRYLGLYNVIVTLSLSLFLRKDGAAIGGKSAWRGWWLVHCPTPMDYPLR